MNASSQISCSDHIGATSRKGMPLVKHTLPKRKHQMQSIQSILKMGTFVIVIKNHGQNQSTDGNLICWSNRIIIGRDLLNDQLAYNSRKYTITNRSCLNFKTICTFFLVKALSLGFNFILKTHLHFMLSIKLEGKKVYRW